MAEPIPFHFYYDKAADGGTNWLVLRGDGEPLSEAQAAKIQREINKGSELSILRFGPSWRAASNGRAYDFWAMIVDRAGVENPPEATLRRELKALGGKLERERADDDAPKKAREDSPEALDRMASMAEQLRTMRRTLERAVEDAKSHRRENKEHRAELEELRREHLKRGKRIEELEAELGWVKSKKSNSSKMAKLELVAKERTLQGFEAEMGHLREELAAQNDILERLGKPKESPMEAFRFAFENRLDSARLYYAQAATTLFHRLAHFLHIDTRDQGWMKIVRERLISERVFKADSKEAKMLGWLHGVRTQVIHDNYTPTKMELKSLARDLNKFALLVTSIEEAHDKLLIETPTPEFPEADAPSYGKSKRARKGSLRDKRAAGRKKRR